MLHDFFLANKNEFTDPGKEFNKLYDENFLGKILQYSVNTNSIVQPYQQRKQKHYLYSR